MGIDFEALRAEWMSGRRWIVTLRPVGPVCKANRVAVTVLDPDTRTVLVEAKIGRSDSVKFIDILSLLCRTHGAPVAIAIEREALPISARFSVFVHGLGIDVYQMPGSSLIRRTPLPPPKDLEWPVPKRPNRCVRRGGAK
ncbi:hypothetical protein M2323_000350 [Rhodoblastus acidophilus]|uniref:hypothetical protein n=1 Tax=Rhodoblastus acidophilus TaxID=1074 RepID=UPI002224D7AE|nr:hypothetical protein [Rhodoblastus acidophilus]MCW2282589.1 hypothetical protein [Rhodoblastus acidophilus]MCW2331450.1 hypothetical protein [Rhodoblastus acidophilus]